MSIFDGPLTTCMRENNRCKAKNKCNRYMQDRDTGYALWEADYFQEYGHFCKYFVPMPKEKIVVPETKKSD